MNNELVSSHEEWKPIRKTNNIYSVSSQGRVRNNRTGYILKPIKWTKGYMKVNLKVNGNSNSQMIHRLVAMAFIPNPENKPEVNHKNGIHDDNRIDNLEWATGEENRKHAYDTGLIKHKDDRYSGYLYHLWKRVHRDDMCAEWQDYIVFYEWCHNNGYSEGDYIGKHRTDRKYGPINCYISKTISRNSKKYICFGEELTLDEISEKYSIFRNTLQYRINSGMPIEDAINCKKGKAKDNCIKIRLSNAMYEYLYEMAHKEGYTVSAYIRGLIDQDMKDKERT